MVTKIEERRQIDEEKGNLRSEDGDAGIFNQNKALGSVFISPTSIIRGFKEMWSICL